MFYYISDMSKKQMLIIGIKDKLLRLEHILLGKHDITHVPSIVKHIGALAYDSAYNNLLISDLQTNHIISLNLDKRISETLDIQEIGRVIAMDYGKIISMFQFC